MASNLDIVDDADGFPYEDATSQGLYLFRVAGLSTTLGYILPFVLRILRDFPGWSVDEEQRTVVLESGQTVEERSAAIRTTILAMYEKGCFSILKGWRDETFPVFGANHEVVLHIERCACPLFGVVTYGVHVIAYVPAPADDGAMKIWISRRARSKQTFGGMLDSTAAGGVASGETPLSTVLHECGEEASLPSDLVRRDAKAIGAITHFYVRDRRSGGEVGLLQPECQYVYELPVPADLVCKPNDNEVEAFQLLTVGDIMAALARREFKPNSALVMLDFMIRHGVVTSENEKDYLEIMARLHRRLEFPLR
ncbi:unnamed protein product [Clonostachys rhizophaga]|uniref:Nudix hydrolase domain-containing protein n=1 Tax=Clonostachys rhizophaga TaxID=160324 RepID=A0A9N9YPR0_9HYPO|nr:unnamed protein product [Clonostachys rhizophaga]